MDNINLEFSKLFGSLIVDKRSAPSELKRMLAPDNDFSPKMSAAQSLDLICFLPNVFCVLIESEQAFFPYIDLLLTLKEIFDLLLAPKLTTDSLLAYFSSLLTSFISKFKACYPRENMRPKMHFLIHYPSIENKNIPLRNFWCMNFERLNGAVKVPVHIMKFF